MTMPVLFWRYSCESLLPRPRLLLLLLLFFLNTPGSKDPLLLLLLHGLNTRYVIHCK